MLRTPTQKIWGYTSFLGLLLALSWVFVLRHGTALDESIGIPVLLIMAGVAAAESKWMSMQFFVGKDGITYSLAEIPLVVGLIFVPPSYLIPSMFVTFFFVSVALKRALMKCVFNAVLGGMRFGYTWIIVHFAVTFTPIEVLSPPGWILIAMSAMCVNYMGERTLQTVIYIASGQPPPRFTAKTYYMNIVASVQGLMLVVMALAEPYSVFLFFISITVYVLGSRAYLGESEQRTTAEEQAKTDPLTGLNNRLAFDKAINDLIANESDFGVAYIDLDNFKTVNDTYGHNAGDEVLVVMSSRLMSSVRAGDTAVRMGGDEFAVIFGPETNREAYIKRISESLNADIVVDGTLMPCGASVGLAVYSEGESKEEFLDRADSAMYTQKQQRKAAKKLQSDSGTR